MHQSTSVFIVQHLRILPSGEEDLKMIGVYSSLGAARNAVARLKAKPGFIDNPYIASPDSETNQGFYIEEYTLDKDQWDEGFVSV